MTTVTMNFGDGSFKEIEVEATDPEDAVEEAAQWVKDNAWFDVMDEQGQDTLAERPLIDPYGR